MLAINIVVVVFVVVVVVVVDEAEEVVVVDMIVDDVAVVFDEAEEVGVGDDVGGCFVDDNLLTLFKNVWPVPALVKLDSFKADSHFHWRCT